MAEKSIVSNSKLTAIADAIRSKTGSTDKLKVTEMASAISGISTSSSSGIDADWVKSVLDRTASGELVVPAEITSLGSYSFSYLSKVTKITLSGVQNFTGENVFTGCTALTEIDAPEFLFSQNVWRAFYNLQNLVTVNLPKAITLKTICFGGCKSLKNVSVPKITSINGNVFEGCTSLEKLDFSDVFTHIYYYKNFAGCTSLKTVILRKSDAVVDINGTDHFTNTPIASGTGYIYVADDLVDTYKSATNWCTFAAQIKGISELPTEASS